MKMSLRLGNQTVQVEILNTPKGWCVRNLSSPRQEWMIRRQDFNPRSGTGVVWVHNTPTEFQILKEGGGYRVFVSGDFGEIQSPKRSLESTSNTESTLRPGQEFDVRAGMPGRVLKILAQEGELLESHAPLLVLEAMKMENEIRIPGTPCRVDKIFVEAGRNVENGTLLALVEATEFEKPAADFPPPLSEEKSL